MPTTRRQRVTPPAKAWLDEQLSETTPTTRETVRQFVESRSLPVRIGASAGPSLAGGLAGAKAGAALGALGGPFAPATVPLGGLLGGMAGGFGGEWLGQQAGLAPESSQHLTLAALPTGRLLHSYGQVLRALGDLARARGLMAPATASVQGFLTDPRALQATYQIGRAATRDREVVPHVERFLDELGRIRHRIPGGLLKEPGR